MAAVITSIVPTTEIEAINLMLASIGEAQLPLATDLSAATQADVELAINTLRDTTREVQRKGWKFNTEGGLEVAPTGTVAWEDTDGVTTTLNVFKLPSGILKWSQTLCSENGDLDLTERLSKQYTEGGPPAAVLVLYDLAKNRDGADSGTYPYVYLDVVAGCNFEQMPEVARRFTAIRAARALAQRALGSESLSRFAQGDEQIAYRDLESEQGIPMKLNVLETVDSQRILGGRPRYGGGRYVRVFPGGS